MLLVKHDVLKIKLILQTIGLPLSLLPKIMIMDVNQRNEVRDTIKQSIINMFDVGFFYVLSSKN